MNVSFYNGVSGVRTQQFGIDTWGNNIANVNTIGYKYSDPQFASILSQAVNTPAIDGFDEIGMGSTAQATALNFKEGIIKNTDREFDLAIQGKGFFGVQDADGVMNYTRNGAMYVNGEGHLVDQFGNFVLGQKAPNLSINSSDLSATVTADNAQPVMSSPGNMQKIQIPLTVTHPGKPGIPEERTTSRIGVFEYEKNKPMDYNFFVSTNTVPTIIVTDESGLERGKIYLDSTGRGNHDKVWDGAVDELTHQTYQAISAVQANASETDAPITIADGDIKINGTPIAGLSLTSTESETNAQALTLAINAATGTTGVRAITDGAGKITLLNDTGEDITVTTSNGASTISGFDTVDGSIVSNQKVLDSGMYTFDVEYVSKLAIPVVPEGNFAQYQIDVNGKLIAQFDNGMESTIAQIPVYQFQNEQGLEKIGDSLFRISDNSGQAFFYKDGTGSYMTGGTIMASSLEMSNVSLATALTELMVTQKAFDANAKSITTSDQMIQRAINLKRG